MAFPTVSRFPGRFLEFSAGITTVITVAAGIMGCSAAATPAGTQDPGVAPTTGENVSTESNPYGVAYPTKGFGTQARKGAIAGGVFKNFKFYGYPGGDGTNGLQTISMAKYLDPEMRNYKVLVMSLTGVWCTYCRKETVEIIAKLDLFKGKKIGMMQAVAEGSNPGVGATKKDFESWVTGYKHNFDVFLDDGTRNLAPYFQSGGLPFNIVLDARTMEILAAVNGAPTTIDTAYDSYVSWVDKNAGTTY